MFLDLQNEITDRILSTKLFFNAVRSVKDMKTTVMAKGLIFVQLYAIYEYAVSGIVKAAILEINNNATSINNARLELLGMALDPEIAAVIDSGRTKKWAKKFELFRKIESADPIRIVDSFFPDDGSHYRLQQLK